MTGHAPRQPSQHAHRAEEPGEMSSATDSEALAGLKDHVIVCGTGPTAQRIIAELEAFRTGAGMRRTSGAIPPREYVVVARMREDIDRLRRRYPHMHVLIGDPTEDEILAQAGVQRAYGVFAALADERDNLFITFTARHENPDVRIVARTTDVYGTEPKLKAAGANAVISPSFIGGLRLVSETVRPSVAAFLDEMLRGRDTDLGLVEVCVQRTSALAGRTLRELSLPARHGLHVVALHTRAATEYAYNPGPEARVQAGDTLVLFGARASIDRLVAEAGPAPQEEADG